MARFLALLHLYRESAVPSISLPLGDLTVRWTWLGTARRSVRLDEEYE